MAPTTLLATRKYKQLNR